ncbi:aminopeptidase A [Carbonactinospora thermoautotrophica]|uniref:Probable cytosol aminopeptidase n=2 Tax=Carbonactinospora thermoautotrophica TaxID=1469144 RepID=A0A132MQT9_9ACTN|nr:leucyl aminopeptidase [Carbonactinospora thermoautotrophica]KWX00237.1 aminopeptidase A [Carbonactinospora thermoautotrophica]
MTSISLSNVAASSAKADALVVGVAKGAQGVVLGQYLKNVDKALKGKLVATLTALGATGKEDEVTKVPTLGALGAPVLVAVGLGPERADGKNSGKNTGKNSASRYDRERLRRAAGAAVRALAGTKKVAIALPVEEVADVAAVAEGALLGAYSFDEFRGASKEDRKAPVETVTVLTELAKDKAAKAALARAETVAEAVRFARDLTNTPPSQLHPKEFAEVAAAAAKDAGLDVEVLDEAALAAEGYGGILGVGQGSAHPPRLVRITYRPKKATKHVVFIGKGITFDSGGLSLKPAQSMEWMKSDMAGAAAVVAAISAIARLGLPVNVTAYAPMAENMPSGTAIRPSDVLKMYGGKTVEVLNTDAEGRLILADAIARASEDSPDLLVDVATLTGAQMVALGSHTAGIMSNDEAVLRRIHELATDAGEQMWPMPLPEDLRKSLDSPVADIANMGDRYGGMLVAALFLREFVGEGIRWAHLDIAGPSFNNREPYGYTPKGGTGAGVRTLVRVAEDVVAGNL